MTPALCAVLLGFAGFAADPDPEPPKPKPKAMAPSATSPDKRRMVTAAKNIITVTDSQTGKAVIRIQAHTEDVVSVGYGPDGKMLASGDNGGALNVFDAATGKTIRKLETKLKGDGKLAFSPDGKSLTWTVGKNAKTLDIATGKLLR
jgi:WD40 repeat protein